LNGEESSWGGEQDIPLALTTSRRCDSRRGGLKKIFKKSIILKKEKKKKEPEPEKKKNESYCLS
jgi:hypothetical protein